MHSSHLATLPFGPIDILQAPFIYRDQLQWNWEWKGHDHFNLWICIRGKGFFRVGDQEHPFEPWTAVLLKPRQTVHGWCEANTSMSNFAVHWRPASPNPEWLKAWNAGIHRIREVDTAQTLIHAIMRLSGYSDALATQQVQLHLFSMLGLIAREWQAPWSTAADRVIAGQIERLAFGEELFITIGKLAREAALSRVHYTRRFKKLTGQTPIEYLVRKRVEQATILLRETSWTLQRIAERIGYSDHYYFCRQFKEVMQQTPGHYRKQMRN